jgi:hypothetical protein
MTARVTSLDSLLALLKSVKKEGGQYKALCPAHNDCDQSLSIKLVDRKILLHCFAGCDTARILKTLNLEERDLFLDNPPLKPTIVKVYPYHNIHGNLLFEVVRYQPKDFRQRRPDGKGDYIWNLKRIEPVLYHLPAIPKAIDYGDTIFVVEGEKDTDTLWEHGLVATTSPMGAGKWRDSYSETLRGGNAVIIPDNDRAGIAHAHKVAQSLQGKAARIRILTLPANAKDVTEFFEQGGDTERLDQLLADAIDYKPDTLPDDGTVKLVNMADVKAESVEFLWCPYIVKNKLNLLEGDPGEGKSWLSLAIVAAQSLGRGLPNCNGPTPGKVLIMSAEDGLADTIRPRLDKMGADVANIVAIDRLFSLDDAGILMLELFIRQVKPALLIIDPVMAYLSLDIDIHKANHVRHVLARLAYLAEKYRVTMLAIRHLTKSPASKGLYRGIGSIDFTAAARSVLLAGEDGETGAKGIVHLKCNLAPLGEPVGYEIRDGNFFWLDHSDLTQEKILAGDERRTSGEEARNFLLDTLADGEVLADEIFKQAKQEGIAVGTLKSVKKQLGVTSRREGIPGERGKGQWYWALPEAQKDD